MTIAATLAAFALGFALSSVLGVRNLRRYRYERDAHALALDAARDEIAALRTRNARQAARIAQHAMDAQRGYDISDPQRIAYALQEAVARKIAGAELCERN